MQLQDLASHSGRSEPLHVVAPVQHPRTLELINYVTHHSCSTGATGHQVIGAVKAATGDPSYASHGDGVNSGGVEKAESGSEKRDGAQSVALSVDVLLPDELLSGLLTQVSVQPELLSVMNDLFDAQGIFRIVFVFLEEEDEGPLAGFCLLGLPPPLRNGMYSTALQKWKSTVILLCSWLCLSAAYLPCICLMPLSSQCHFSAHLRPCSETK